MKKCFSCLLFLCLLPCYGMAEDFCTNPEKYTVDKRCYVTDAQKQTKPFNSVARLFGIVGNYCSGTLVNGVDGVKYLYTAAHCVLNDFNKPARSIRAKTSIGNGLKAKLSQFDLEKDLAIYITEQENIPYVDIGNKAASFTDVQIIGYGDLAILSDETIKKFKRAYADYLVSNEGITAKGTESKYGFTSDGGIIYKKENNDYIQGFLSSLYVKDRELYDSVFENGELKVSTCKYYTDFAFNGCQVVGGDSGAGMFDSDGNILGVVSKAMVVIGGKDHAKLMLVTNVGKE